MDRPAGSWAPALLAGHGALAGLLVAVAVLTAASGTRTDATPPWGDGATRAVVLGLAFLVVAATVARVGRRRPRPGVRWWSVVLLWLLAPWILSGLWLGGSSPAALALGIPLLAFYIWPYLLAALVVGVGVATSLVRLDH